jgi:hypothetical protein
MAFDPLSESTRKARRSLLGMASATIVTHTFNVQVEDIPLVGIKIDFGPEVLAFVFGVGLIYFSVTFIVYYLDDFFNMGLSPFEEEQVRRQGAWLDDTRTNLRNFLNNMLARTHAPESIAHLTDRIWNETRSLAFSTTKDDELKSGIEYIVFNILGEINKSDLATMVIIIQNGLRSYEMMKRQRGFYPSFGSLRLYILDFFLPILIAALAFLVMFRVVRLQWLVGWFG